MLLTGKQRGQNFDKETLINASGGFHLAAYRQPKQESEFTWFPLCLLTGKFKRKSEFTWFPLCLLTGQPK
jgi:hypothetical protein